MLISTLDYQINEHKEILLQEAQRQLLYYENQTRACLKVRHSTYMGKIICLQFLTWLTEFPSASAELTAIFQQAKGNESDLKKTFHTPLPVVICPLKFDLVF